MTATGTGVGGAIYGKVINEIEGAGWKYEAVSEEEDPDKIEINTSGQTLEYEKVLFRKNVDSVALDKNSASLEVKDNMILTAVVAPDDAADRTVKWSSSDSSVAAVDDNGKVTAAAAGTASASYDADNKILTLNNYSFSGEGYADADNYHFGIYAKGIDLTIHLVGKSSVTETSTVKNGAGIGIETGNLTFTMCIPMVLLHTHGLKISLR